MINEVTACAFPHGSGTAFKSTSQFLTKLSPKRILLNSKHAYTSSKLEKCFYNPSSSRLVVCSATPDEKNSKEGSSPSTIPVLDQVRDDVSLGVKKEGENLSPEVERKGAETDESEQTKKDTVEPTVLVFNIGPPKVSSEDAKVLQEKVFGYRTFWVTSKEPFGAFGEGILFKGNLRGNREEVFEKIQEGLKELFQEKYTLFMIPEPEAEEEDSRGGPRVSFVMAVNEAEALGQTQGWEYVLSLGTGLITVFTCFSLGLGAQVSKLPPEYLSSLLDPNSVDIVTPADLEAVVPLVDTALSFAAVLFSLQLVQELGHRIAAWRNGVKLGLPFLIFNSTLGSFGGVTPIKSLVPNRNALFDTAVAGPLAGGLASLAVFFTGLSLTASPESALDLVKVPAGLLQDSLLLGLTCRAVLGYEAVHSASVAVHPLLIAGWCGLWTSALNLLPVGNTDGGRCTTAAFGKGLLRGLSLLTYLLLGIGILAGPVSLPYGLFVLIFQREPEKACVNDVTGVGNIRQSVYIAGLTLALFTLLPIWDQLADELGIGLGLPF